MSQRNRLLKYFIVVMAAAMLVACEKDVVDEATSNVAREASTVLRPVAVVTLEK
jgi:hypothetical protein